MSDVQLDLPIDALEREALRRELRAALRRNADLLEERADLFEQIAELERTARRLFSTPTLPALRELER